MTLVTALLAKNEGGEDRYLKRVLENALSFSDKVLLLDDSSTDSTREIALDLGVSVSKRPAGTSAWGAERSARAELWDWGAKEAKDGWLLIQDADMILVGDPRPLTLSWEVNAWAWPLVDLWDSETTFRVDGPWAGGPRLPRAWLFRPSAAKGATWNDRGIHVGHAPNFGWTIGVAPGVYWKHYAYLRPEHRKAKFEQYMGVKDQLSPFEFEHAQSILR